MWSTSGYEMQGKWWVLGAQTVLGLSVAAVSWTTIISISARPGLCRACRVSASPTARKCVWERDSKWREDGSDQIMLHFLIRRFSSDIAHLCKATAINIDCLLRGSLFQCILFMLSQHEVPAVDLHCVFVNCGAELWPCLVCWLWFDSLYLSNSVSLVATDQEAFERARVC